MTIEYDQQALGTHGHKVVTSANSPFAPAKGYLVALVCDEESQYAATAGLGGDGLPDATRPAESVRTGRYGLVDVTSGTVLAYYSERQP